MSVARYVTLKSCLKFEIIVFLVVFADDDSDYHYDSVNGAVTEVSLSGRV